MKIRIQLYDGKYTYINDEQGQRALRHGEPWRDLIGDGFVLAMAQKIQELQEDLQKAMACDDTDAYCSCPKCRRS